MSIINEHQGLKSKDEKGTRIQLGDGDGPTIALENDAASQYTCQTDAIKTLVYKYRKWKNIYDQ